MRAFPLALGVLMAAAWAAAQESAPPRPLPGNTASYPETAEDETALRALASRMVARWNARDADGVTALFDGELALVRPQEGPPVKGSQPVGEWVRARLAQPPSRLSEAPSGIRFVGADAAFVLLPLHTEAPAAGAPAAEASWAMLAVKEPRKVKHVNPYYPDEAKQARIQGVVILECTIDTAGRVQHVRVLRGVPQLNGPAIDAVRQWVYTPTLLEGQPVPVIMTVTVNFRLQ